MQVVKTFSKKQIPSDHDYFQAEPDQFQNTLTMPKKSVSPRKIEIKEKQSEAPAGINLCLQFPLRLHLKALSTCPVQTCVSYIMNLFNVNNGHNKSILKCVKMKDPMCGFIITVCDKKLRNKNVI